MKCAIVGCKQHKLCHCWPTMLKKPGRPVVAAAILCTSYHHINVKNLSV